MNNRKLKIKSWLPFILSALLTSGCTRLGPDFEEPLVATPESYRTEAALTELADDLQWWKLFDDPYLVSLVSMALERNRDLRIAVSRIAQSRAALGFTEADEYPRLDLDGGINRGNFTGTGKSPNTDTSSYITAPLSWEIDFWGKFSRATEAARADLIASEYGLKTVQLTLVSEVVASYTQLLDFHRRLAISENTLKSRTESLYIIQQRFDKGIIPELDVNWAQIEMEIAAAAIPLYQRSIAKTENSLSILLGHLPGAIEIRGNNLEQTIPPTIPVVMPVDVLDRRPDITQAKFLLKAQSEQIGIAEALRWPSLSLTATLGVANTDIGSLNVDGDTWSLGGRLLGPIFDFDKNKNRVLVQEQITQQFLLEFENLVLTAFQEVEDALVEITTYRQELAAVGRQLVAARNANKLSRERYNQGVSSYLEVLETERRLFSTELTQSETKQLFLNSYVNLYKALGGGWVTAADREQLQQTANYH
jgi:multidrug efflux system outer membrane protein